MPLVLSSKPQITTIFNFLLVYSVNLVVSFVCLFGFFILFFCIFYNTSFDCIWKMNAAKKLFLLLVVAGAICESTKYMKLVANPNSLFQWVRSIC